MGTKRSASGKGSLGAAPVWRLHDSVVVLLLVLILGSTLNSALREANFGIDVASDGRITIRDFASHLKFAQTFWFDEADYSTSSHVQWTNRWAGQPVDRALPFGYSPTMLWILAPFCVLPLVWGYAAWTVCGAAAVGWMTRRRRTVLLAGPLVLLGPLGVVCFALGQTAFLTAAAIMFLMLSRRSSDPDGQVGSSASTASRAMSWSVAAIVWALTAKPPLAIVAGIGLLGTRRWRPVAGAVGLAIVSTLLLTPKLGADWVQQYVQLMTHYDREMADEAFVWSLRPDTMTNLRGVMDSLGFVGDITACRISSLLWLGGMFAVVFAGLLRRLSCESVWGLSVLAYLLFCPHVTSTEDLHLIVLVAIVAPSVTRPRATGNAATEAAHGTADHVAYGPYQAWTIVLLVLAATTLAPSNTWLALSARTYLVFGIKLTLAALLVRAGRQTSMTKDESHALRRSR